MLKIFLFSTIISFQAFAVEFKDGAEFLTPTEKAILEKNIETSKIPSLCERTGEFFERKPDIRQQAKVHKILVDKNRRMLYLLNQEEEVLANYKIALGGNPVGHKNMEGDQKTPEGLYFIELKNFKSDYYLSLGINYPNAQDRAAAFAKKIKDPGKEIMIHGLPNNWFIRKLTRHPADWTKGCMAVTNEEIKEIYSAVSLGTLVEICP